MNSPQLFNVCMFFEGRGMRSKISSFSEDCSARYFLLPCFFFPRKINKGRKIGIFERTTHSRVRQDKTSPNSGLQVRQCGGFGKIPSLNGSRFGKRS